eukprot:3687393-Pyramimonas_sp.AAC.1
MAPSVGGAKAGNGSIGGPNPLAQECLRRVGRPRGFHAVSKSPLCSPEEPRQEASARPPRGIPKDPNRFPRGLWPTTQARWRDGPANVTLTWLNMAGREVGAAGCYFRRGARCGASR